jgi:hypothetical protein
MYPAVMTENKSRGVSERHWPEIYSFSACPVYLCVGGKDGQFRREGDIGSQVTQLKLGSSMCEKQQQDLH